MDRLTRSTSVSTRRRNPKFYTTVKVIVNMSVIDNFQFLSAIINVNFMGFRWVSLPPHLFLLKAFVRRCRD